MNELVKALKNFIVRDIIYIIGGASVILSFLYLFNKLDIIGKEIPTAVYLFLAGIAYVIGYCIQELFSLAHIVTTASYFEPWLILRRLYYSFLHRPWTDIFPDIPDGEQRREHIFRRLDEAELKIQEKACPDNKAERERLISLMLVGTSIGPCSLVSGFLLLYKAYLTLFKTLLGNPAMFLQDSEELRHLILLLVFHFALGLVVLLIGGFLIMLGWVKALQAMKYTEALYTHVKGKLNQTVNQP